MHLSFWHFSVFYVLKSNFESHIIKESCNFMQDRVSQGMANQPTKLITGNPQIAQFLGI